jgi:hypothetical protein
MLAGGFTDGKSDPSVIVGMNDTSFYYRSSATSGNTMVKPLPTKFAKPVILTVDRCCTHPSTLSHADCTTVALYCSDGVPIMLIALLLYTAVTAYPSC